HMDGARFASALASLSLTPKELTWQRGVDVLCLGGTKNGMAVGDCVVFFDNELAREFEYRCKQAGQLASKMRYLAAPWARMLTDDTWIRNARHANRMASKLADGLALIDGVDVVAPVQANAVFVRMCDGMAEELQRLGWQFYPFGGINAWRLMCSWATVETDVQQFVADAQALSQSSSGSDGKPAATR
ncbi:MAG: beta-eliminating lyase-related protein, partial [Planctomycetota bacterium]